MRVFDLRRSHQPRHAEYAVYDDLGHAFRGSLDDRGHAIDFARCLADGTGRLRLASL
jgi:hypothetical protein